jgi:multidrug efflux pump subunit AcrB
LQVKNEWGEMVPISNFVKITKVYGPEQLTRYNMNTAAMFNGEAAQGYSTGQAIEIIEEVARETLSQDYTIEWAGITREEILAGDQTLYIYILVVIFVFLLLAAQYESFKLPLPVLLSVITGIMGSFMFLKVFGLENNIYAQVSIVMLIGLLGKNAILIVEFANQAVEKGMQPLKAAVTGAVMRFRPILMTSFCFIVGLIPLALASGAGAIGNKTIGITAIGGMLIGTLLGLVVTPGLFVIFAPKNNKNLSQDTQKN